MIADRSADGGIGAQVVEFYYYSTGDNEEGVFH